MRTKEEVSYHMSIKLLSLLSAGKVMSPGITRSDNRMDGRVWGVNRDLGEKVWSIMEAKEK